LPVFVFRPFWLFSSIAMTLTNREQKGIFSSLLRSPLFFLKADTVQMLLIKCGALDALRFGIQTAHMQSASPTFFVCCCSKNTPSSKEL
jgi:hypothetical protein